MLFVIERARELEKALKKSGGRAVILVHPLFHEYHATYYLKKGKLANPVLTEKGRDYLEKQALVYEKTRLPVIIFEEEANAAETKKKFSKAFVVPTKPASPQPTKGWKVIDYLKRKGLKTALLGGQKMVSGNQQELIRKWYRWTWKFEETMFLAKNLPGWNRAKEFAYDGCVSQAAYNLMRKKIRVGLMTRVVYPNAPVLKKARPQARNARI
jgi:hypothetical protein